MGHNPNFPKPEEVIPHRPPHLWLDGVTDLTGSSAKGFWTPSEEHFLGHFDGMPLLPGVKQVESLAQLGAYAVMSGEEEPVLGLFKGIEDTDFERPVRPGEMLDLSIIIADRTKRDFKGLGIAQVSGVVACRTTIVGTLLSERAALRLLGQS